MHRLTQLVLIVSTLIASWLGLQVVHEFGHVLGAWMTGGIVRLVALNPFSISRTELSYNPHPLVVVWAGPVVGVALPLLFWAVAKMSRLSGSFVLRFFAGFCLIANGLYIGVGSFNHIGDCGEMLRHGSQLWQLRLFGLFTAPVGVWLWHGQGRSFGLGVAGGEVNRRVAYSMLAFALVIFVAMFIAGGK
jgi:hypothetical protein